MKNKEKYLELQKVFEIAKKKYLFTFNEDGKIVICGEIECGDCSFNVNGECENADYKEKKELSE